MTTAYITHADCLKHEMGAGHPECPDRLMSVNDHMKSSGLLEQLRVLEAPLAAPEDLKRVHAEAYVDLIFEHAPTEGWRLKLCATEPKWYSDTVSAIMVPDGINGAEVISRAFKRYNLALGAGLSKVAGKLFRIGHLGDLNELMLLGAIAGAEMAMLDVGVKVEPGSGVAAAQKFWRNHALANVAGAKASKAA